MDGNVSLTHLKNCMSVNNGDVMLQRKILMVFLMLVFWAYSEGCVKKTKEEHYSNGKLKAIYSYNDKGLLDGVVKKYYPNGVLNSEATYKNDVREGILKKYDQNGYLVVVANFKDDKLDGLVNNFYNNGKLRREANFKDDKNEGMEKEYYEDGNLKQASNYAYDKILFEACYDGNGKEIICPKE